MPFPGVGMGDIGTASCSFGDSFLRCPTARNTNGNELKKSTHIYACSVDAKTGDHIPTRKDNRPNTL